MKVVFRDYNLLRILPSLLGSKKEAILNSKLAILNERENDFINLFVAPYIENPGKGIHAVIEEMFRI